MDIPFSFSPTSKQYGARVLKAIFLEENLFCYGFDQEAFFGAKVTVKAAFNKNFHQPDEQIRHIEKAVWIHKGDYFPWSSGDAWYESAYHQALVKQAFLQLAIDEARDYSKWVDVDAQTHLFGRTLFTGSLNTPTDVSEYLGILNEEMQNVTTDLKNCITEVFGENEEEDID